MSAVEPEQVWWSADELATSGLPDLPGTVQGINQMANQYGWRCTTGCAKRKVGRGGGWRYHWSVLPLATRQKLLKDAAKGPAPQLGKLPRGEAWAAYDALKAAPKAKAKKRLVALQLVETLHMSGLSHVNAVCETAKQANISPRSIYNWLAMIEGVASEDRLAYLVPRHKQAERRSTKATCSRAFMEHLKGLYLRNERPTFAHSFRLAIKEAQKQGWDTLTKVTAKRQLEAEVPRVTRIFAREGESGLMRCFPAQIRDRTGMSALEGVNADCHKIDVFVIWPDGKINRPQIVGFQDLYSGKILSWRVDHDPNKVMVMAAFGEMVDLWGIPKHCLFDNGHEFANKWMTAGTKTRFRFKVRDDDPLGVLPLMGIQVHWATPAHGQAKPIERAFRDFASDIAKDPRFHGAYVGNRPDAKPENYGSRAIPIDTFLEVLSEGVAEHNERLGRLSPTAQGRSFNETFSESYVQTPIRKATEEQRRLWMMGQHNGKLNKSNGLFKMYGNEYYSEWMSQRANEKVIARFDPEDLHSGVYIYTSDGAFLGFAECRQKVGFFDLTGAREEAKRKSRIKKLEKALLKEHRPKSIEQIAAEMTPTLPISEDLTAKVVSMPQAPAQPAPPRKTTFDPIVEATRAQMMKADRTEATIHQLPTKAMPSDDAPKTSADRFWWAQSVLQRSDEGKPIGSEEARQLKAFMRTAEYQANLEMFETFGASSVR